MGWHSGGTPSLGVTNTWTADQRIELAAGPATLFIDSADGGEARLDLESGATSTRLFYRDNDDQFGIFHKNITRFRIQTDGTILLVETNDNARIGMGTTSTPVAFLSIAPTWTHDGVAGTVAAMIDVLGSVTGAAGDTSFLMGMRLGSTIITQTAVENIIDVTQLYVDEPSITKNLTGNIDHASVILINGIPTEGVLNAGILIDGGGADETFIALAASDVATGLSTLPNGDRVGTDWFLTFAKGSALGGGILIQVMAEDAAIESPFAVDVWGGTATTTKTTAGRGLISFLVSEHNGANAVANITADGNVFSIVARVGGADVARFMVDDGGDLFAVNATIATFDAYDDAALLDTFDRTRAPELAIRQDWAGWSGYNEQTIIDCGILGGPIAEGGMVNITQLQRAEVGAIRQAAEDLMSIAQVLSPKQRMKLTPRVQSRLLALQEA